MLGLIKHMAKGNKKMAKNDTAKSGNGGTEKKSLLGFEADLFKTADKPKFQPLVGEIG